MYYTLNQVMLVSDKQPRETDHAVYVKETNTGDRLLFPAFVLEQPGMLHGKPLERYGVLYYDANETPCIIPDVWKQDDALVAKGWR